MPQRSRGIRTIVRSMIGPLSVSLLLISPSQSISFDSNDDICRKIQAKAYANHINGSDFLWPSRLSTVKSGAPKWKPIETRKNIELITDIFVDDDKNTGPIGRSLIPRTKIREQVIKGIAAKTIRLDLAEERPTKSKAPILIYRVTTVLLPKRSGSTTREYVPSLGTPTAADIARNRPPADSYPFNIGDQVLDLNGADGNLYSIDLQQTDLGGSTGIAPVLVPLCQIKTPDL